MGINARYALIAACMMHVEGFYSIKSLAFQRKNPGNINVHAGQAYPSIQDGFNALVADIAANSGSPLQNFIAKYAPSNENDSFGYALTVSTLTGIGLTEKI